MKRFPLLLSLPLAVLVIGTTGFMIFEKLPFIDALYFTIVTISTVGYGDIHPTSIQSKLFGIFLIVIGIGTFLTIVTSFTQLLVQRGQDKLRRERINMLIGVFFTEMGNQLLKLFVQFDPNICLVHEYFPIGEEWSEIDFLRLKKQMRHTEYTIDPKLMDLTSLTILLKEKGDLLLRHIEAPEILENEAFTELLWAVVHLRDELIARNRVNELPDTDQAHLANDAKRAYKLLVRQWFDYMQYLKQRYPHLFSLALRINPFNERSSVIIQ